MLCVVPDNNLTNSIKLLQNAANSIGYLVNLIGVKQLFESQIQLNGELVFNRNPAYDYNDGDLDLLSLSNCDFINGPDSLRIYRDKWKQYQYLSKVFAMPKTWPLNSQNIEFDGGEYYLKTKRGMGGYGVRYYSDYKQLNEKIQELLAGDDHEYVIQQKIDAHKELRLYVFKGEVIACIEKLSSNGFFNRQSADKWQIVEHGSWLNGFTTILKNINLDLMAVDFLISNRDIYLLEVNACPGVNFLYENNILFWEQILSRLLD